MFIIINDTFKRKTTNKRSPFAEASIPVSLSHHCPFSQESDKVTLGSLDSSPQATKLGIEHLNEGAHHW